VVRVARGALSYVSGRVATLMPEAVRLETPNSVIGVRGTHASSGWRRHEPPRPAGSGSPGLARRGVWWRSRRRRPAPAPRDLVVLVADPESGEVGGAVVANPAGRAELTRAGESTTVASAQAPGAVVVLSEAEIQRMFGAALAVIPEAAVRFNLYFHLGGVVLTPESSTLMDEVIALVSARVAPEVSAIGHTDTTGTAEFNHGARACSAPCCMRDLLVEAGLDGGPHRRRVARRSRPARADTGQHARSRATAAWKSRCADAVAVASRLTVGVAAAALAVALTVWRPWPLGDADLRVYDTLVRADPSDADGSVHSAVVAIDDSSLSRLGQWPWPRSVMAALVDRLQELGAAAIGLDMLLAEAERDARSGDAALAQSLARAPVVTGHAFVFDEPPGAAEDCVLHPLELVRRQRGGAPPDDGLFRATGGVCTLAELAAAAGASGFINASPDPDGLLRRTPLVMRFGNRVYPSLALAVARRAGGAGPVALEARSDGSLVLTVGSRAVALDERGRLLVRAARSVRARTPISAADVIDQRVDPQQIRGRAVFVGATALGLRDSVVTAADRGLPGVVIHAAIADTLLGGAAYERGEFAALTEVAAAALTVMITGAVAARAGLLAASFAGIAMGALAWWGCSILLAGTGQFFSPLWPVMGVAVALVCEGASTVLRERQRGDREQRKRSDAQRLIVQTLTTLTETRDIETGQHARRTQAYTHLLATALASRPAYRRTLTADRIALIATLAPLHDIGKVGVPDAVLRKPGALTPDEYAEMQRHPGIGHESLLKAEFLAGVHDDEVIALAKEIVYTHHERWDGSGYPRGLRGADIPISGRIVALVDTYDALVSDRAYQGRVSHDAAVEFIAAARGTHFDPDVVEAFLAVRARFQELSRSIPSASPAAPASRTAGRGARG
jgi:CHASE2 domain-containing sensor protein